MRLDALVVRKANRAFSTFRDYYFFNSQGAYQRVHSLGHGIQIDTLRTGGAMVLGLDCGVEDTGRLVGRRAYPISADVAPFLTQPSTAVTLLTQVGMLHTSSYPFSHLLVII